MIDPQKEIVEYIERTRSQYTRAAIDRRLRARGYSQENINAAWQKIGQNDAPAPPNPGTLKNPLFWLVVVAYVLVGPFILGLIAGLLELLTKDSRVYYSNDIMPPGTGYAIVAMIVLFFTSTAAVYILIPKIRWLAAGIQWGVVLLALGIFIPPFILSGICTAGVRLVYS